MSNKDEIITIIASQAFLGPNEIKLTDRPSDLGLDSIMIVECIFALEEKFDISMPFNANTQEAANLDISTIGALVDHVERLIKEKAQ